MAQPTSTELQQLLVMLEYNLELIVDYMDADSKAAKETELTQYILSAISFITREGINSLKFDMSTNDPDAVSDCMLVVMYASYLYDERKNGVAIFPRALRYNLNNRLLKEKVNA